jgi:coenzyme F420-dependent glucose-6-phosphate dehydrogenase
VIGPAVTPSLKRYHPALVAQAFSTFEELFPGRTFLAVGSGESLNETPFGCDWPDREGRFAALAGAFGHSPALGW